MPSGSCFCGKSTIKYTEEPAMKALCHCGDCKKISGGAYSVNVVVPEKGFESSGPYKTISKTADSGNPITSHFCSECGTTVFRDGDSFPGLKIIKAGVLDDASGLNEVAKPGAELFAAERVPWVQAQAGAEQKQGMS